MKILFIDSVCYKPYTCNTLRTEALGGTEATVLRVARGLAKVGHTVGLFELIDPHREVEVIDGVAHINDEADQQPDVVVHLRTARLVAPFREAWPDARHIVWMHDLGVTSRLTAEPLQGLEVVCVSDFHAKQWLKAEGGSVKSVTRIYNPVEVDSFRYPKAEGRLGFFSSPHKGLAQVISKFEEANKTRADKLHLVVGNPGYINQERLPIFVPSDVTFLGELPHHKAMEEMSKCQALFYPQDLFPETFGLVLAEANAMSTPVIAHSFGAAAEVLQGVNTLHNVLLKPGDGVSKALDYCLSNGGLPKPDPRFEIDAVVSHWVSFLGAK